MAEPAPENNNVPEVSFGSHDVDNDRNMEAFGNSTPHAETEPEPEFEPNPEPQCDFSSTFGVWWDVHCYGFGVLFLLICIYAVRSSIMMFCRKQGRLSTTKPFLVFINVLVIIMCLLRAVYLFVNPYNQVGFFPVVVNNILFNIPFPCMTASFAMILWVLREVSQVKLSVRSRSRSLRALFFIAATHLGSVIIISTIIEFTDNRILLIVTCHGFFVLWELFLCFSASLLMYRISKAVRKTGKTLVKISTMGHSTTLHGDVVTKATKAKSTNASRQNEISLGYKNDDKLELCKMSTSACSDIQTFDECYEEIGEVDVQIVDTPSPIQLYASDHAFFDVKSNLGKTTTENALSDESHNSGFQREGSTKSTESTTSPPPGHDNQENKLKVKKSIFPCANLPRETDNPDDKMAIDNTEKLAIVSSTTAMDHDLPSQAQPLQRRTISLNSKLEENKIPKESSDKMSSDQTRSKPMKQKVSISQTIQEQPATRRGHPVQSTIPAMAKRARLTRKVTRITVVTTITSFIACILNLFFILSLFPGTDVFQGSRYSIFIFWTCFRVTEIAMACVILYFVAQPMPKSKTRSQQTFKRSSTMLINT